MTTLPVDGIELAFDDAWLVVKWDESRGFLDGIRKLNGRLDARDEGTKAVDLVGLRDGALYLFEVKDFRGAEIENKKRQLEELPLEIGLKARDTLAGLLGQVSLDKQDALALGWIRAMHDGHRSVQVVALLAEDAARPGEPAHKRIIRADERTKRLKQRLAWLTPRVVVNDPLRDTELLGRLGIEARSMAGAGPARPAQ